MNALTLFSQTIAAVRSGDLKAAACNAGQLAATLTCDAPAALRANASENDAPVLTAAQFHAACNDHCKELEAACNHSDHCVKTGIASDTALPPGIFAKLAAFILSIVTMFVKPAVGGDTPTPAPAPVVPPAPPEKPVDPVTPPGV